MKAQSAELNPREIRKSLGLNQSEFWSPLGVTQSGGSRYESGRNMPTPVKHLLRLIHIEHIDVAKIRREDVEVIEFLKSSNPTLFKELKQQAKTAAKAAKTSKKA
jgi:transcriptional regulator with XRE-family HTH domain